MVALFSGRFDCPHAPHLIQLLRLTDEYDEVHVVMLDYPGRGFPLCYCAAQVEEFCSYFPKLKFCNSLK